MTPTEIVYALLKHANWTQTRLSKELGYSSPGTMSTRLARGNMTVISLAKTAEVMGYEVIVRSKEDPQTEFVVTAEKE